MKYGLGDVAAKCSGAGGEDEQEMKESDALLSSPSPPSVKAGSLRKREPSGGGGLELDVLNGSDLLEIPSIVTEADIETSSSSSSSSSTSSCSPSPLPPSPPVRNQSVFDVESPQSGKTRKHHLLLPGEAESNCNPSSKSPSSTLNASPKDDSPKSSQHKLHSEADDDAHAIQVENDEQQSNVRDRVRNLLGVGDVRQQVRLPQADAGYDCNSATLCGPKPKRIAVVLALVLSVWASIVLAVHINKKVSGMEDSLHSMSSKIDDLEGMYLKVHDESSREINRLHERMHRITQLQSPSHNDDQPIIGGRQSKSIPDRMNNRDVEDGSTAEVIKVSQPTKPTAKKTVRICTVDGRPCILPFMYKGENRTSCIREWYRPKSWCPTRTSDNNEFVDDGSGNAWGNCGDPCP